MSTTTTKHPVITALLPFLRPGVSVVFKTRDYGKYGTSQSIVLAGPDDVVEIGASSDGEDDVTLYVMTDYDEINSTEGEVVSYDGPIEVGQEYATDQYGVVGIVGRMSNGAYGVECQGSLMTMSEADLRRAIEA